MYKFIKIRIQCLSMLQIYRLCRLCIEPSLISLKIWGTQKFCNFHTALYRWASPLLLRLRRHWIVYIVEKQTKISHSKNVSWKQHATQCNLVLQLHITKLNTYNVCKMLLQITYLSEICFLSPQVISMVKR